MKETFAEILAVGGKSNSLGRADEITQAVLQDGILLESLYQCLLNEDAWVRMRAADSLEKICRAHPDWLKAYIDRLETDVASSTQPSIQWHLAQIYREVDLTPSQKRFAIKWLKELISSTEVDWIVAANTMDTLAQFVQDGSVSESELSDLLKIQLHHKSKSVVKRANRLLGELT